MKNSPDPAEVWVLHENQALLFRQHEGQDIEELRMSFNTFVGSATALASFSLPDTRVYLNLGPAQSDHNTNYKADPVATQTRFWAGLADSPTRLVVLPSEDWQLEILAALKSMGKKARVISASNATHFRQATKMILVHHQELKHLESALRLAKSGSGKHRIALQVAAGLWIKPHRSYQKLRWTAACGILVGILAMIWPFQHKADLAKKNQEFAASTDQKADRNNSPRTAPAPFSAWAEQLRKFGQDNRANLLSLSLFWTDQGQIHTQVQLDRERKRVPKGCKLTAPDQATCTTGRNDQ